MKTMWKIFKDNSSKIVGTTNDDTIFIKEVADR